MDRTEALDRLRSMVAADDAPTLDETDLEALLDDAALYDAAGNDPANTETAGAWAASTDVTPDTVIAVTGGRYWRCYAGGTTAAAEPAWPPLTGLVVDDCRRITDGSVVWVDNGTTWTETWDLNRAAMLGWERKAAAVATRFDVKTEDQQFSRSQIAKNCLDQADRYRDRIMPGIA